jgi:hypothetical protein
MMLGQPAKKPEVIDLAAARAASWNRKYDREEPEQTPNWKVQ